MSTNIGYQILQAVKRRVEGLGLSDIRDISLQTSPLSRDQIRPGAYVTPPTKGNGDWDSMPAKTNERQIVSYGCQITVVHGSLNEWNNDPVQLTDWRQAVRRTFHDKRLNFDETEIVDPGFTCWGPCKVIPGSFEWDADDPDKDTWYITALVVRVVVAEARSG
jgi:hypothetical protein